MKIRRSSYFTIVIMGIMAAVIILSIQMEYAASKVLPLILGSGILVLGAISLISDSMKKENPATSLEESARDEDADQGGSGIGGAARVRGYLIHFGWFVGFVVGIYVFGFFISIFVFMIAYMRTLKTRWFGTIVTTFLTIALVYGVFERALELQMYRGLIFELLAR